MLFKVWIRCYCYNNKFVLHLKRNMRRWSNVLLLLCSPYLLLRWACLASYECLIGKRLANRELLKDRKRSFKYDIALVSISKNEGPYVREWIEFHRMIGISKFYFYDNESDDDTADILAPYIADGVVDYTLIRGKGVQLNAYNEAIRKHRDDSRYMAFLDMDEYLTPIKPFANVASLVDSIIQKAGGGAAGVGVNWAIFGTAHHKNTPSGLLTAAFNMRGTEEHWGNFHIKTVCNPRFVDYFISPHYPLYKIGAYNVGEADGHRLWGWFCVPVKWMNLRVNHYYCKSEEQYMKKISRGFGDRVGEYDMKQFHDYDLNDIQDDSMMVYKNELETRVFD